MSTDYLLTKLGRVPATASSEFTFCSTQSASVKPLDLVGQNVNLCLSRSHSCDCSERSSRMEATSSEFRISQ